MAVALINRLIKSPLKSSPRGLINDDLVINIEQNNQQMTKLKKKKAVPVGNFIKSNL